MHQAVVPVQKYCLLVGDVRNLVRAVTAKQQSNERESQSSQISEPLSPHDPVLMLVPLVRQSLERRRQLQQRRADAARVCRSC